MSRIKRLVRPDTQALNWKAAIPVLGLAGLCLALHGCATTAPATAPHTTTRAVVEFASCAKPQYPADDLHANHEGTVTLGFLVTEQGAVSESKVIRSSGFRGLDDAARTSIEKCHFQPATDNGQPVQSWTNIQYVWVSH